MSLDDRLPDLLRDAAQGADRVPPTDAGVRTAIGRRATRRRRQKLAGAVAGSAFVVACVGGALALSGTDGDNTVVAPAGTDGELPYIGLEIPGFHLERTEGEQPPSVGLDINVVLFTDGTGSADGPVLQVSAMPPSEPTDEAELGEPVDLDGDGGARGPEDGWLEETASVIAVGWRLADGGLGVVGGLGQSAEQVLAYTRALDRSAFDPLQAPTPDGLPHREVVNLPDGAEQRVAYYTGEESDAGTTWTFHVLTLDQTGWFDLLRVPGADDDEPYVEVPLGDSILGPGVALLREVSGGDGDALIRTDAGLTIQVVGPQVELLREAIEAGRFVELDPTEAPQTTTSTVNPADLPPELASADDEGCEAEPGSPTSLVDEPANWLRYGQYHRWRDAEGCPVRIDVISSNRGAEHCGWEDAWFLTIGRPLGEPIGDRLSPETANRYVWNAGGAIEHIPPAQTIREDEIPATAEATGYQLNTEELWIDPADESAVYLVGSGIARKYVRDFEAGLCR